MNDKIQNICILFFCLVFVIACDKVRHGELVLYDFESESVFDEIHWKCHTLFSLSDKHAAHGKRALKLEFFASPYPGFSPALKYHDWKSYQNLCFEVYNPEPNAIKLVVRIDDKKEALEYADRYNKSFVILPGPNTLKIPLDTLVTSGTQRSLELKKIYRFLVFMSHPDKNHVLYFDYFRLVSIKSV